MSHTVTRTALLAATLACILAAHGCDPDDRADEDEGDEIAVGQEQEEAMCVSLGGSTSSFAVAGAEMGQGHSVGATGAKRIELVQSQGQYEGWIELEVEDGTELILLIREALPFATFEADGEPAAYAESGTSSELCPEANGRYLWAVTNGYQHFRFGPTALAEVNINLEVVE